MLISFYVNRLTISPNYMANSQKHMINAQNHMINKTELRHCYTKQWLFNIDTLLSIFQKHREGQRCTLKLISCYEAKGTKQEKCQTVLHFLPKLIQTTTSNSINTGLRQFFNRLKHGIDRNPRKRKSAQHEKNVCKSLQKQQNIGKTC